MDKALIRPSKMIEGARKMGAAQLLPTELRINQSWEPGAIVVGCLSDEAISLCLSDFVARSESEKYFTPEESDVAFLKYVKYRLGCVARLADDLAKKIERTKRRLQEIDTLKKAVAYCSQVEVRKAIHAYNPVMLRYLPKRDPSRVRDPEDVMALKAWSAPAWVERGLNSNDAALSDAAIKWILSDEAEERAKKLRYARRSELRRIEETAQRKLNRLV